MTDYKEFTDFTEAEREQFTEFKRRMNMQAAQAQVGKLEFNLTEATLDKVTLRKACQDASSLKLGAVCVLPNQVKPCISCLGTNPEVSVIACISYPHGGDSLKTKVDAVKHAIKDGADEVEVTAPIAYVKDGNWNYIKREFKKLKSASKKKALRIDLESPLLTEQELIRLCTLAADCGITSLRLSSESYSADGINGITFNVAETITRVKTAVKDKCTIKADGALTMTDVNTAVEMGAVIIGSKNAPSLAKLILQTA